MQSDKQIWVKIKLAEKQCQDKSSLIKSLKITYPAPAYSLSDVRSLDRADYLLTRLTVHIKMLTGGKFMILKSFGFIQSVILPDNIFLDRPHCAAPPLLHLLLFPPTVAVCAWLSSNMHGESYSRV